jgi:hypothetical protein
MYGSLLLWNVATNFQLKILLVLASQTDQLLHQSLGLATSQPLIFLNQYRRLIKTASRQGCNWPTQAWPLRLIPWVPAWGHAQHSAASRERDSGHNMMMMMMMTRDRLTSELSTMMTVCTFIGGFIFTTLVDPAGTGGGAGGPAGNRTMIMLQSNITGSTTQYYTRASTFSLSSTQVNSTEAPPAADSAPGSLA